MKSRGEGRRDRGEREGEKGAGIGELERRE